MIKKKKKKRERERKGGWGGLVEFPILNLSCFRIIKLVASSDMSY